jgi:hypothetical protein
MSRKGYTVTRHPVSTSKRRIEVPIKLNAHTGVFWAEVDGEICESDRLLALRSIITSKLRLADGDQVEILPGDFRNVIDIGDE